MTSTASVEAPRAAAMGALIHPEGVPSVRRVAPEYPERVGKDWCAGSAFKTQWLNAYTLIIPEGEKFIHRSLRAGLARVEEPVLRAQLRGLFAQEMTHSVQHQRFWHNLRSQGFAIDRFLQAYAFLSYRVVEPLFGENFRIAGAVGLEHLNAFLAEVGLDGDLLEGAEPSLRELFEWHYAEEIEHKNVAFDLFQTVSGNHTLRVVALCVTGPLFLVDLCLGTLLLLAQERQLFNLTVLKEAFAFFWTKERFVPRAFRSLLAYCARDFHPRQVPNEHLAERILSRYARELAA